MPTIRPQTKTQPLRSLTLRVPADILAQLHQYSQFIESSQSYIVAAALRPIFADPEFEEWCQCHPFTPKATAKTKPPSIPSDPRGKATPTPPTTRPGSASSPTLDTSRAHTLISGSHPCRQDKGDSNV